MCMYLFAHTYKISQLLLCMYVLKDTYTYKHAGSLMKIVKAGVAGPAASDRGGEAEMRAPTKMRPTTPAKIKPRSSRHARAADEPATAEAVPLVG